MDRSCAPATCRSLLPPSEFATRLRVNAGGHAGLVPGVEWNRSRRAVLGGEHGGCGSFELPPSLRGARLVAAYWYERLALFREKRRCHLGQCLASHSRADTLQHGDRLHGIKP